MSMGNMSAAQAATLAQGVDSVGIGNDQWSQASTRDYRIFTDQWGREWGADCEIRTGHPCGPLAALFRAPIYPPQKYIVITDTMRRRVAVNTSHWIADLQERQLSYEIDLQGHAQRLFGNRSADVIREAEQGNVDPTLYRLVGRRPMPIEVVQAMIHDNPWVLGLKNPDGSTPKKPAKAPRDYFPDVEQLKARDPFALEHDPWAEEKGGGAVEIADTQPASYPHMFAPGKWWLSDEHRMMYQEGGAAAFSGKRTDAEQAINEGRIPVNVPVADPNWDD